MLQFVLDLQSGNNDKIKQAEAGLSHYQLQDVAGFCTECINIMNDNNATSETRQFTGTLLRRTVLQNVHSLLFRLTRNLDGSISPSTLGSQSKTLWPNCWNARTGK